MVLLEDTRNQIGKHKNISQYCKQIGITLVRSKLYVGDYQIANNGNIAVDTKASVLELASNVFQEHRRFRDECIRAQEAGIQLIILIEEALPDGGLRKWKPPIGRDGLPLSRINPTTLRKAMITMQAEYGVKFRFCDGRSTGKIMIEYLKGERT